MSAIIASLAYFADIRFVLLCGLGSIAGLFVGSIPGLSVSMATALLVSITYSWSTNDALATVMGVYVVGVFSGALSAILINIPGAPSSVVTTLDGYPLAKRGEAYKALKYATIYSFIGSVFGLVALALLAQPITSIALKFQPMDYFLLALFGLATVGGLTTKSFSKGLISALFGLFFAMIGMDSVLGTPRLTFGIRDLNAGISNVPALVGLFGFAEVLSVVFDGHLDAEVNSITKQIVKLKDILKDFWHSLYYSAIGTVVGALPGAGGPVAAFLAYTQAKDMVKNPSRPFGEGAVDGIVAAIILSVFYVHGLQPGPMFLKTSADSFHAILGGGFVGCLFLLLLGLLVAPHLSKIIAVPKSILMPIVTLLCVIGAYACNNRLFDVGLMFFFGVLGFLMRCRGYSVAPMTLAIVLGNMMDSNFRRAISLAVSSDNVLFALFGRPITMVLLVLTVFSIVTNIPAVKRARDRRKAARQK